jgi:hypothetical protein
MAAILLSPMMAGEAGAQVCNTQAQAVGFVAPTGMGCTSSCTPAFNGAYNMYCFPVSSTPAPVSYAPPLASSTPQGISGNVMWFPQQSTSSCNAPRSGSGGSGSGSGSGSGGGSGGGIVCPCCTNPIPTTLTATFVDFPTSFCHCQGGSITLTYDVEMGQWIGSGPFGTCGPNITLALFCQPELDWEMNASFSNNCALFNSVLPYANEGDFFGGNNPAVVTCSPFYAATFYFLLRDEGPGNNQPNNCGCNPDEDAESSAFAVVVSQ